MRVEDEPTRLRPKMSQYSGLGGSYGSYDAQSGVRQPGSRRAKLKGYLQAANEIRKGIAAEWDNKDSKSESLTYGSHGAYPDAAIVHGGEAEMILFPSYARKHVKQKPKRQRQYTDDGISAPPESVGYNERDEWHQKWEQYEEDNAVVDVDVRGWIYTPQQGPLGRRQRFYFTLARQLAGLPTTTRTPSSDTPSGSRGSSPRHDKFDNLPEQRDADEASKEAERIVQRGEAETAVAQRGGYTEAPAYGTGNNKSMGERGRIRPHDDRNGTGANSLRRAVVSNAIQSGDDSRITTVRKQASWTAPGDMTESQLSVANANLMARLMPFISTPMANTAISAFFFNDEQSRQRTIFTNASGHFALRAALDFVPTHVRILASDKLSATEEVIITDPVGVNVISDIDDTIKHTAMTSGARESFRNAFIRELEDLKIDGVREWYNRMAKMGVYFHYVSNTPWQLYPMVARFLVTAGLPAGSVHLKLYSGVLQGIFEPVAERKKSTMDRLARDFPERKFILIGDSGEADLEVYTDFVIENPGRVLGVFIRDVTTPVNQGLHDSSINSPSGDRYGGGPRRSGAMGSRTKQLSTSDYDDDPDLKAAIAASLRDFELEEKRNRPALPRRPGTGSSAPESPGLQAEIGNLIDFSDDDSSTPKVASRISQSPERLSIAKPVPPPRMHSDSVLSSLQELNLRNQKKPMPPPAPEKPMRMRSSSTSLQTTHSNDRLSPLAPDQDENRLSPSRSRDDKAPPPKPPRPSSSVHYKPREPSPLAKTRDANSPTSSDPAKKAPPPPARPSTYTSLAKQTLSSAYNHLPNTPLFSGPEPSASAGSTRPISTSSARSYPPPPPPPTKRSSASSGPPSPGNTTARPLPPPPPPRTQSYRKALATYPAAAAQFASSRVSSAWSAYQHANDSGGSGAPPTPPLGSQSPGSPGVSKREGLWRQRWMTAEYIFKDRGVVLRTWRVGKDVEDECCALVEKAMAEYGKGGGDGNEEEMEDLIEL